jgi:hypothetical protein
MTAAKFVGVVKWRDLHADALDDGETQGRFNESGKVDAARANFPVRVVFGLWKEPSRGARVAVIVLARQVLGITEYFDL